MTVLEEFSGCVGIENFKQREDDLRYVLSMFNVNNILEFGSGTSTKIFSDHVSFIQTVDESRKYLKQTKKAVRKDNIVFSYSPRIVHESSVNYKSINYARTDFDMIYVDGPNAKKPGGQHTVCMDTMLYLYQVATVPPNIIMVDGRRKTVDFLRNLLIDYDIESLERHSLFIRESKRILSHERI